MKQTLVAKIVKFIEKLDVELLESICLTFLNFNCMKTEKKHVKSFALFAKQKLNVNTKNIGLSVILKDIWKNTSK